MVSNSSMRAEGYATLVMWTVPFVWLLWLLLGGAGGSSNGSPLDASQYYLAGRAFLTHRDPYRVGGLYTFPFFPFRQWPLVTALCAPIALLPQWLAVRCWMVACGVGLVVGFGLVWRRLAEEDALPRKSWLAVVALGPAPLSALAVGQMSALCFAAYALGLRLLKRHPCRAGLCFALIGAKPHLALLAIPALLSATPSATVAFALGMLCWPVGSIFVSGPGQLIEYGSLLLQQRADNGGSMVVAVPLSFLLPLGEQVHAVLQLVFGALMIALLLTLFLLRWRAGRRPGPSAVDRSTALVLAGLPYAVLYDLTFLAPSMLRLGVRPGTSGRIVLAVWWFVSVAAIIALRFGIDGLAAVIPPVITAVLTYHAIRDQIAPHRALTCPAIGVP